MNAPMTLREAVEIVALSRGQFAVTAECEISGDARSTFASLWDSINAKSHPWASNPWVWVVEFERVEKEPSHD